MTPILGACLIMGEYLRLFAQALVPDLDRSGCFRSDCSEILPSTLPCQVTTNFIADCSIVVLFLRQYTLKRTIVRAGDKEKVSPDASVDVEKGGVIEDKAEHEVLEDEPAKQEVTESGRSSTEKGDDPHGISTTTSAESKTGSAK